MATFAGASLNQPFCRNTYSPPSDLRLCKNAWIITFNHGGNHLARKDDELVVYSCWPSADAILRSFRTFASSLFRGSLLKEKVSRGVFIPCSADMTRICLFQQPNFNFVSLSWAHV